MWPPTIVAAVLLIGRHLFRPTPSLAAVVSRRVGGMFACADWRTAIVVGATSRIAMWLVALLALTFGADGTGARFRSAPGSPIQLEDIFLKWDGGWYVFTAAHGYVWEGHTQKAQNVAFFPAYPLLVRTVGSLMGARVVNTDAREGESRDFRNAQERRLIYAGLMISCLAFVWGLRNLAAIATLTVGPHAGTAVVLLLAWYPFAVFYGEVYTESLFFLALTGAWLEILRDRWGRSAAWGLLLGLTRPVGFLVSIPIAILALKRFSHPTVRPARMLLSVCAPVAGVLVFSWYMHGYTGHWLEWMENQGAWNRFNPDVNLGHVIPARIHEIWTDGFAGYIYHYPAEFLNAAATVGSMALIIPIGRRLGVEYAVLTLLLVGLPLFAGGFMTMGRFTAPVFPIFIYLATVGRAGVRDALVPVWATLQGLVTALHTLGKPLY